MAEVKAGTWIDTKARKIVTSPPEEGVLLVPPDAEEITKAHEAAVELARTELEDAPHARDAELAAAAGDGVETATVDSKSTGKRAAK